MTWRSIWLAALAACVVAVSLVPITASADDGDHGGFVVRVNGPFTLAPGESVNSVVVVKGDALIGGTVRDTLVVINGHADIAGRVEGNVTIVKGDVTLEGGAPSSTALRLSTAASIARAAPSSSTASTVAAWGSSRRSSSGCSG